MSNIHLREEEAYGQDKSIFTVHTGGVNLRGHHAACAHQINSGSFPYAGHARLTNTSLN